MATTEVLYFVLDGGDSEPMYLARITDDKQRATELARNIGGVVIGFPVNYYIADFRDAPED